MKNYNANQFLEKFNERRTGRNLPDCPYCGGQNFTVIDSLASIIIGKDLTGISLGPSIPSGVVVCTKCGHLEFFALGALGLLPKKEDSSDGK